MRLRRLPTAIADVDGIWTYVRQRNPEAADRLVNAFVAATALLEHFPLHGAVREDVAPTARGILVRNYLILYRVNGEWVEIVRVVHGARDMRGFATDFAPD